MCDLTPGLCVLSVLDTGAGLQVAGASAGFAASPTVLAETVVMPAWAGGETIAEHQVYGTARLDAAVGAGCRRRALSLPDTTPPARLVLGAPGGVPASGMACVCAAIGQVTVALRLAEARQETVAGPVAPVAPVAPEAPEAPPPGVLRPDADHLGYAVRRAGDEVRQQMAQMLPRAQPSGGDDTGADAVARLLPGMVADISDRVAAQVLAALAAQRGGVERGPQVPQARTRGDAETPPRPLVPTPCTPCTPRTSWCTTNRSCPPSTTSARVYRRWPAGSTPVAACCARTRSSSPPRSAAPPTRSAPTCCAGRSSKRRVERGVPGPLHPRARQRVGRQLDADDFVPTVRGCLAETATPASRLVLEIADSPAALSESAREHVNSLAADGVQIALDDVDTSAAGLAGIAGLAVGMAKVSSTTAASGAGHAATGPETLLQMAQRLGLRTVVDRGEGGARNAESRDQGTEGSDPGVVGRCRAGLRGRRQRRPGRGERHRDGPEVQGRQRRREQTRHSPQEPVERLVGT